jgi:hypothetical protein
MINRMRMKRKAIPWYISLVGIVVVAVGVMAAATYLGLERKIVSGQAYAAMLERLYHDQQLSVVLRTIHDGEADTAARRLDLILCDDILAVNSQLASASNAERDYAQTMFAQIARQRPGNGETFAVAITKLSNDQIEAERILRKACAESKLVKEGMLGPVPLVTLNARHH